MQLNSLTLNSNTTSAGPKCFLAIYDHNLAIIHTQIFVFGKTFSNFSIQTPLHKINMRTLEAEAVYTTNAPTFEKFIMFCFERRIYFFGKKPESQNNQLYQFDGCKFSKLDQRGSIPNLTASYSYTTFSHEYVLLFLSLCQNQLQNKWYIFDIKNRQWKQIFTYIQIPICERSSILWRNGRGYLLLQSSYIKNQKKFIRNNLYELKLQKIPQFMIKCQQIHFSQQIQRQNITFLEIFSIQDKYLMIIGSHQQNKTINEQLKQYKIHDHNEKIVYKFDLELFQWVNQNKIIKIKGLYHKIITYDSIVYFIGGIYQNHLLQTIQFHNFINNQTFPYEQSLCYTCESAFTYYQKNIYQPMIQREYQSYSYKNRIQNKLVQKLSQSITNQIQAFGIICQFFIGISAYQIKINLFEDIRLSSNMKQLKSKIQSNKSQIVQIKGKVTNFLDKHYLTDLFANRQKFDNQQTHFDEENQNNLNDSKNSYQQFYTNFTKLKTACYKLGIGFLYITLTQKKQVFVGYCSYSQTNMPQSYYDSITELYYCIKYDSKKLRNQYSSKLNRQIIFQNVKLYFSSAIDYQNSIYNEQKNSKSYYSCVYIIQVGSLQKSFNIQLQKNSYYEDISVKSFIKCNKSYSTNSLRNYLKHYLLHQQKGHNVKLYVQNREVQVINLYQRYNTLSKETNLIKLIYKTEQNTEKSQNNKHQALKTQMDQTRFSQNPSEVYVDKKMELIEKCALYQSNKKDNKKNLLTIDDFYASKIFLYQNKRFIKVISSRKQYVCGVIQLVESTEIMLNRNHFVSKKEERKLALWIDQIQNLLNIENLNRLIQCFKLDLTQFQEDKSSSQIKEQQYHTLSSNSLSIDYSLPKYQNILFERMLFQNQSTKQVRLNDEIIN